MVIRGDKSLSQILDGLPPLPSASDKPEIVAPTVAQRERWTKNTRLYVEHLEGFIHEMRIEVGHIAATMKVLRFGDHGPASEQETSGE